VGSFIQYSIGVWRTESGLSDKWKIREYREGDEKEALRLFQDTFKKRRSVEEHRWKFLESPERHDHCGIYVAVAGDRIIGQFGGVAQPFKLGEAELTIMQGCDVLTAADSRRHGVLASVGRGTFDAWKADGFDYCVGLENKKWGSRIQLLGLEPCLQTYTLSLTLRPDLKLARVSGLPARFLRPLKSVNNWIRRWPSAGQETLCVRSVERPELQFDLLWKTLRRFVYAAVRRDKEWLQYRYFSAPHASYKVLLAEKSASPLGYICYRVRCGSRGITGIVVDLFAAPTDNDTMHALISAMLNDMQTADAETVAVPLVAHPPTIRALERYGFRRRSGYTVVVIPLARTKPDPLMRDPNRWFTMPGDFDIV
jgi:hypothetical protein